MTRSRDVADTQDNIGGSVSPVTAGKNAIINGAFDIWQRGTSTTSSTNTAVYSGADRWQHYSGATTNYTLSRQSSGLTGFQYCARVARNSASTSTNLNWFTYSFESADCYKFAGKTVTLSFYARAGANFSAASSYISVLMDSGTGTDQNILNGFTGSTVILSSGATLTTSWQRFTFTMSVASSATQLGLYIRNTPVGTAGAADHYEITGVQLELGSVATPFSRAGGTIQGELAACQRYYWRKTATSEARFAFGSAVDSTTGWVTIRNPVTMRANPTSIEFSGVTVSDGVSYTLSVSGMTNSNPTPIDTFITYTCASGQSARYPSHFNFVNGSGGHFGVNAEL
jgi:hypothetical protein